jgi:hypothetical protein
MYHVDVMQSLALTFVPTVATVASTVEDDHALIVPSASAGAIPVRKEKRAEELRDLVSVDTVKNLSDALDEPVPESR